MVATASCVMVHTNGAAEAFTSLCPETKVRVLPHPVLQPRQRERVGPSLRRRFDLIDRDVLLMFGFIHPHKGLDDLVAAFSTARGRCGPRLDRLARGGR